MSNPEAATAALCSDHLAMIEASGISPEVSAARQCRCVTRAEARKLGFSESQARSGLLLPIWNVYGEIGLYQLRPDQPRAVQGKLLKYETVRDSHMMLDVPPTVRHLRDDPSIPLVVTEGIKKADAGASVGLFTVALLGVWNWRGTNAAGGKVALPDWEGVALNGRRVYIAFDSDVMTKVEVHKALARLGDFLRSRKSEVHYIYLPPGPHGEKVGLDDYLRAQD